jgi:hypothetical protein
MVTFNAIFFNVASPLWNADATIILAWSLSFRLAEIISAGCKNSSTQCFASLWASVHELKSCEVIGCKYTQNIPTKECAESVAVRPSRSLYAPLPFPSVINVGE